MATISPGLYSAGSIVVRGINNGVESEYKIMDSFISPYQARDIRIIRGLESWSIIGTGDMFAKIELLDVNSDSFLPPIVTEVNEYGEFELVVDDSVVEGGATYNLRMNKDLIESIVEIPFIEVAQPKARYDIPDDTGRVYIIIETQSDHTYEYTLNGGITWNIYFSDVILSGRVYSDGLIQVRAIRDEYVSRPISLGPIIDPYYISPDNIVPHVEHHTSGSEYSNEKYIFSGTAQPNSLVTALDIRPPGTQIFVVTVGGSGRYHVVKEARDLPYKLNVIRYTMTTDQFPERYHDDSIPLSQLPSGAVSTYYNGSNRIIVDVFPPTDYDNIAIRRYNGEYTEDGTQLQYELQYNIYTDQVYNLYIDGMDYGYITVPRLPVAKYDTVISYQELSSSGLDIRIQMPPGMGYQSVGTIEWDDDDLPIRSGIYTESGGVLVHYPGTDFPTNTPPYIFHARASGRNISRSLSNIIQVIDADTISQELIAGQSINDDLIIYLTGITPLGYVSHVDIDITSITSNPSLLGFYIPRTEVTYSTILQLPNTCKLTIGNANLETIIMEHLIINGIQPDTYVIDSLRANIDVVIRESGNIITYHGSTMMNNLNMTINIPQP